MSTKKGLLRGSKFNGKHSTVIPHAERIVRAAKGHPAVRKVVLSVIKQIGGGRSRLTLKPIDAGLEVRVRGGTSIQTFYVYTSAPAETEAVLQAAWATG